jgi:hypothetical protein
LETIFSAGVFPLRLQLMTQPFSVPTIKRVGIVPSYSRHEAPRALLRSCSSPLTMSSISVSVGSFSFRVSHHLTCYTKEKTLFIKHSIILASKWFWQWCIHTQNYWGSALSPSSAILNIEDTTFQKLDDSQFLKYGIF